MPGTGNTLSEDKGISVQGEKMTGEFRRYAMTKGTLEKREKKEKKEKKDNLKSLPTGKWRLFRTHRLNPGFRDVCVWTFSKKIPNSN